MQCLPETLSEPFQPSLPKSWYFREVRLGISGKEDKCGIR